MASASAIIASQNRFFSGLTAIKAPRFSFRPPKKYSTPSFRVQSVSPAPQRSQPPLPSTATLNPGVPGGNLAGRSGMGRPAGGLGTQVPILRAGGGGARQEGQLRNGQVGPNIFRQPVGWNMQRRLPRPGDGMAMPRGKAGAKRLWAKQLWKNTKMI